MSSTDEFYRDEGRIRGRKDWMERFNIPGWQPAFKQHPTKKTHALELKKDGSYADIGLMTENPLADGYIHQQWEEEKKEKNAEVALMAKIEDYIEDRVTSFDFCNVHIDAVTAYPEHLSRTLDDWRDLENTRDGYLDGMKQRKANKPCAYRNVLGLVMERNAKEGRFVPSKQLPLYVKGYLLGYSGKKEAMPKSLYVTVQEGKLTPEVEDPLTARAIGYFDGVLARKEFGALPDIKSPYMFKNKRLYARVRIGAGNVVYRQITDAAQYAYVASFIKSWKQWERKNPPMKAFQKETPQVLTKRKPRQMSLNLKIANERG